MSMSTFCSILLVIVLTAAVVWDRWETSQCKDAGGDQVLWGECYKLSPVKVEWDK